MPLATETAAAIARGFRRLAARGPCTRWPFRPARRSVRNQIGVITWPNGERYAVAVFTRARRRFLGAAAINAQIGEAARLAIAALRSS